MTLEIQVNLWQFQMFSLSHFLLHEKFDDAAIEVIRCLKSKDGQCSGGQKTKDEKTTLVDKTLHRLQNVLT
jgi:hypothetical protein